MLCVGDKGGERRRMGRERGSKGRKKAGREEGGNKARQKNGKERGLEETHIWFTHSPRVEMDRMMFGGACCTAVRPCNDNTRTHYYYNS